MSTKQTIIEEGTRLKGVLLSTCPVVVRGHIEGDIDTPSLTISEKGSVHGRAKVGAMRSLGELSGEFDADSVELAGCVKDNTVIRTKSLEVKLAADERQMQLTFGNCELVVGDAPEEETGSRTKLIRGPRGGGSEPPASPPMAP